MSDLHPSNDLRAADTCHPDDEITAMIDLSTNTCTVTTCEVFDHQDGRISIGFSGTKPIALTGVSWGYDMSRVMDNDRTKSAFVQGQDYRGYIETNEDIISIDNYTIDFQNLYRVEFWWYNQGTRYTKLFEFKSRDYQDYTPEGYPDASLPEGHEREGRTTIAHNFWD